MIVVVAVAPASRSEHDDENKTQQGLLIFSMIPGIFLAFISSENELFCFDEFAK